MALIGGAPKATIREIDLSTRVPSFPGVYGGIVIEAKKGPVNYPVLITSEAQLLKRFTPNDTVEVGFDSAYFSALNFLQGSDKLWVVRAANVPIFAGAIIRGAASTSGNATASDVGATPEAYVFDEQDAFLIYSANEGSWGNDISVYVTNYRSTETITWDKTAGEFTVAQTWPAGVPVRLSTTGTLPTGFETTSTYYVQAGASSTKIKLALTIAGTPITSVADATGTLTLVPVNERVKEPGAFLIEVVKSNVVIEAWPCSLDKNAKDGFGKTLYIEEVLQGSGYVRAIDNPSNASNLVKDSAVTPIQLSGGTDGEVVTTGKKLIALETLSNPDMTPLTLLMDGGNAVPAYQSRMYAMAEERRDCFAILSVPYANEASYDYLNAILDYRKMVLNANTSYGALYSTSVKVYDKYNDRYLYLPPDGFVGAAISKTAANYEIWYPVGGFRRGVLNVLDCRRRFTKGEMDILYDNGINPIRFAPGKGILIWGQKTLSARPSALDRINVRLMLIVIEPAIREALEVGFLFEFNDQATRSLAVSMINGYMNGIKSKKGVADFSCVCDESNNTPEDIDAYAMNVHLFVKPMGGIEYIPFTVVIMRTGITFQDAAASI